MDGCPKCGKRLILFADYERNNFNAHGVKCRNDRCDYILTFGGLLNHAEEVIKYVDDWPDCCPSLMLEGMIRGMRNTITKGMKP